MRMVRRKQMSRESRAIEIELEIINKQFDHDGQVEIVNESSKAKLYKAADGLTVIYDGVDDHGKTVNSSLRINIEKKEISVRRFGASSLNIEFAENRLYRTYLTTEYGRLEFVYNTQAITIPEDILEEIHESEINLKYQMLFAEQRPIENEVLIRFKLQ